MARQRKTQRKRKRDSEKVRKIENIETHRQRKTEGKIEKEIEKESDRQTEKKRNSIISL